MSGYVRSPTASQLHLWDALVGPARQRWEGTADRYAGEGWAVFTRPRELPSCSSCVPHVAKGGQDPATWLNASTLLRLHVGDACEAEQDGDAWCIAEC